MALTKRFYTNHKTVITAENMNDIQDAIIALEALAGITPGEGEATRNISVVNPNGNYTLAETVALPDGLYWFANPVTFKDDTQTETFQLNGLVAKTGDAWLTYDNGRTCVTDENGVMIAWTYTSLPDATEENEGKVLAVVEGKWEVAEPQQVFPLEEAHVYPTNEPQELLPRDGYCGFSRVLVDASPGGGGGDYPGEDWEPAEDETFGDDYYNVPTGNYDYSAGADAEPSYIPEIPGEGYKALFSQKLKLGNQFHYYIDGVGYDVKFKYNGPGYLYTTYGYWLDDDGSYAKWMHIFLYSETEFDVLEKKSTAESWTDHGLSAPSHYSNGWFYDLWQGSSSGSPINNSYYTPGHPWSITGMPVFDLGRFLDHDTFLIESRKLATSTESEEMGSDQFIAFVSPTQILYDGSVINNADKSPMTIYECNASDKNTWSEIGKTDGTDYQVGAYTLVWNSHDLKDMTGQFVTQSKSDEPIAEMSEGDIGIPVERNETYTIEGETVNTFVSAAQKVTGGKTPLTPTNAALALDEYYNHPAEEGKW